jgi:hypothetical protein
MRNDFKIQKQVILGGLALLVLADLCLGAYSWRLANAPRTPKMQLTAEMEKLDLLRADIRRAEEIKQKMPSTQSDCDRFEQSLRPASSGYSAITAEVDSIAVKSALQMSDLTFKSKTIPTRNLDAVEMDATVSGDYSAVVKFLNGLQRSDNVYEVNGLSVATDTQKTGGSGPVRVIVHMRTYFRTV